MTNMVAEFQWQLIKSLKRIYKALKNAEYDAVVLFPGHRYDNLMLYDNSSQFTGEQMKTKIQTIAFLLTFAFISMGASSALAFDAEYKYTIPTMETAEDFEKVKAFVNTLPGIKDITKVKDYPQIIVAFDDEELDDEKFQLRIPLYKEGYQVTRFDILYEDPNKRN